MAVRVENVVDWDVVMNMYKDMQHMDDDALEDNRHQTDHKVGGEAELRDQRGGG